MKKTVSAFRFSVAKLFETSEQGRPYFWTFTFREKHSEDEAFRLWSLFARSLNDYGRTDGGKSTIYGLRVAEHHPGGHGLHFHVLLNRFIPIHAIRQRAEQFGFFWIDVRRCDGESLETQRDYLAKYMTKTKRPPELKGRRLWAAIGSWEHTKVRDIEIESEYRAAYLLAKQVYKEQKMTKKIYPDANLGFRERGHFDFMASATEHVYQLLTGAGIPLLPHLYANPEATVKISQLLRQEPPPDEQKSKSQSQKRKIPEIYIQESFDLERSGI